MDKDKLQSLLEEIAKGTISPDAAMNALKDLPYSNLEFARVDSHRALRQGLAEAIFSPGKTVEQIAAIAMKLRENHKVVIATKADSEIAEAVLRITGAGYYERLAKAIVFGEMPRTTSGALTINVVTAGTADIPIAEECILFLESAGLNVQKLYDVGVAGIHRLFDNLSILKKGAITIVIAGMDGALPSVVGGIVDGPVIAVPTSVGYGTAFSGIAPLLSMLNSCAAGLTVVNIDNGFGAACAAIRMQRALEKITTTEKKT